MSDFLFKNADGPYTSPCVSVQTSASSSDLVAAPGAGRRIVPVWLLLWGTHIQAAGDIATSIGVYGNQANYGEYLTILNKFYVTDQLPGYRHTEPFFMNFGLGHMNTLAANQKLRLGIVSFAVGNYAKVWAKCGYYIMDV